MLELIERLEAAKPGVDLFLLEPDVHLALFGGSLARAAKCPRYLRSLDAALALAERVLPEAKHWEVCTPSGGTFLGPYAATISDPLWLDVSRDDWESFTHGEASGATPALALVIATLKAISAKGGEHGA